MDEGDYKAMNKQEKGNDLGTVRRSLQDCKEEWASKHGKTWKDVKRDFEYGLGLSKLYDFEQIMDMVAELYRKRKAVS